MTKPLRAPFPWFGGKSRAADLVWQRFGDVPNYVEPFAGSLAVLLHRPSEPGIETVNDLDCYLANFWRAVAFDPCEVAKWADWPVNEADLHARHLWLVRQEVFREKMKSNPDYFDAKIAGWWVWGICAWIGSGWCARPEWSGRISACRAERGVHRRSLREADARRPALGNAGNGIHRKRPRLNEGCGVNGQAERFPSRQLPDVSGNNSAAGRGIHASGKDLPRLADWMQELCERLRRVRVCCGDWKRVLGRSPTECIGVTGVFLDPPYTDRAERRKEIYAEDCFEVGHEVRRWAAEHGDNEKLRIALCGYEGEHEMPPGWTKVIWKANGGHGNTGQGKGRENADRERIWFSPHCLQPQAELFQA